MATEPILAAPGASVIEPRHLVASPVLSDYWTITKPDVNFLIGVTTAAAFYLASRGTFQDVQLTRLAHTIAGTVLVASGAGTLNQWKERDFDARMRRTARRPVAAGRIDAGSALRFGLALSLAGTAWLAVAAGPLPAALAVFTLLAYLFVYTPLKRQTPLCTLAGAVPGAVPPLIGWAAARGRLDAEGWLLFALLFLWQFPHFMAIAWMYRDDYDRAGYVVLPRGAARRRWAILQTLIPLLALIPISLLPVLTGQATIAYGAGALVFGLVFLSAGLAFAARATGPAARQLLLASILYLPSLLVLMTVCRR